MADATIFCVCRFPAHWPPEETRSVFRKNEGDSLLELSFTSRGSLGIEIVGEGGIIASYESRPLAVTACSTAIVDVTVSGNQIDVRLNGTKIEDRSENPLPYTVPISNIAIPRPKVPPPADPRAAANREDRLFLEKIGDIHGRLPPSSEYDLLHIASLLYSLIGDERPLVDVVNTRHRERIRFEVIEEDAGPPLGPEIHLEWLDSVSFPTARTETRDRERFCKRRCISYNGCVATVLDVIKLCRNVKGGVHFGPPKKGKKRQQERQQALLALDEICRIAGWEPTSKMMESLAAIVLRGLEPVARAAQQS